MLSLDAKSKVTIESAAAELVSDKYFTTIYGF